MADRQRSEMSSKSSTQTRPSPQGISLANLSQPLNFGPALMPTLQPVGASESVSTSAQQTPSSSSASANTSGLFPLDPDAEVDSFLGQQLSPKQMTPVASSHQAFGTPQQLQSTSSTIPSFKPTTSAISSTPQQQTQSGPKHFTMAGSGHDVDNFLTPTTQVPAAFASSSTSSSQTPFQQFTGNTPSQPSLSTPHLSGVPQAPPSGPSHLPPRRVYPKVNQQVGYSQSPQSTNSQFPAQMNSSLPGNPPISQFPTQPLYTQGSQQVNSPAMIPQMPQAVSSQTQFIPSNPQSSPQIYVPQGTQQYGAPPLPQQTGMPGDAPILSIDQQVQQPPEGIVPTALIAPVQPHWFYMKENRVWMPFSYIDSDCLEHAYRLPTAGEDRIVPTDGGRYDVNLDKRTREPVYWEEPATVVRRCTWFFKGDGGMKLVPYEEELAEKLEHEFQTTVSQNLWPRRIDLMDGEYVIMHNTNVMVHFQASEVNEWSGEDIRTRPKVVKRGVFDIEDEIEDGEPAQIDHLVFVIHGIGPIADLRFRNIVECVDDLRMVTLSMLNEHHEELAKGRVIGRIEYLPVQWHSKLHDDSTGVDQKLHSITLPSITKLRDFTNSTLLDILFYTSPTYCQTIVDIVGSEMKRLLDLFKIRNPLFKGKISVCGHSLGSSIMFDILFHQKNQSKEKNQPESTSERIPNPQQNHTTEGDLSDEEDSTDGNPPLCEVLNQLGLGDYETVFTSERIDMDTLLLCSESEIKELGLPMGPRKKLIGYLKQHSSLKEKRRQEKSNRAKARAEAKANEAMKKSQRDSQDYSSGGSANSLAAVESVEVLYHQGVAGTGQPFVKYPKLDFKPFAMFALGSPIGMFMTVRGVDQVGPDYKLPTCPRFYNIFHPFDPVAYKVEPIVDSTFAIPPVMLPHHKGRKRMHLELRDNLSRFGANLKASLMESVRITWESINEFARAHTSASTYVSETTETDLPPPTPSSIASDSSEVTPDEVELQEILPGEPTSFDLNVTPVNAMSPDQDSYQEYSSSEMDDERAHHELTIKIGRLNGGNRIDYVLQEKPIESLNEYLFALGSHVCYWLSEDTALFMLREIYKEYSNEIQ